MTWPPFRVRELAGWMALGVCVSIILLTWFGYGAIREWQRSSAMLAGRRAEEAANLLMTALTRDMRAVQKSVLALPDWDTFMLDPPYDVTEVVASAFARYPYPESFFAYRGTLTPATLVFFSRSNRPPVWAPVESPNVRFPVVVQSAPAVAQALIAHINVDAGQGRQFSIFELRVDDVPYQVVTRLLYLDRFRDRLEGVFGFVVNLSWARRHYFVEMTRQIERIEGVNSGLALSVVDDRGVVVASTGVSTPGPISRRDIPLMFFDPLLVLLDSSANNWKAHWTVQVSAAADPTLAAAIRGTDRALLITALAAASLAVGFVLSARAVRARAKLAEMRSEFVATVTHELKTPIATIRAAGDTLATGRISEPAGQREYAQIVVQESKRLTRLVDNLLALSRITDVTEVYSFEPLTVDAVVHEALRGFHLQLVNGRFETRVDIQENVPRIRADRMAIRLLLDNLIDNAVRYSHVVQSLEISAFESGRMVTLAVKDKGCGIPNEELKHVTGKFFRGRNAGSGGSGLGLAIVKRIVTDHGGDLVIQSAVDAGTRVCVSFPIWIEDEETNSRR